MWGGRVGGVSVTWAARVVGCGRVQTFHITQTASGPGARFRDPAGFSVVDNFSNQIPYEPDGFWPRGPLGQILGSCRPLCSGPFSLQISYKQDRFRPRGFQGQILGSGRPFQETSWPGHPFILPWQAQAWGAELGAAIMHTCAVASSGGRAMRHCVTYTHTPVKF